MTDLTSSNGTFLNGSRLQAEAQVLDGDRLVLGETEILLHVRPPEEAGAAPPAPSALPAAPAQSVRARSSATHAAGGPPAASPGAGPPAAEASAVAVAEVAPAPVSPPRSPPARSPAPTPSRTPARFLPAAGFWVRLAAQLVDTLWMGAVGAGIVFAAGGPASTPATLAGGAAVSALALLVPLVGWTRWGTTPGKRLFRLYVCSVDGEVGVGLGRALLRWVGYLLSGALFGLGFVMIGVSAAKRGLHDLVAGTYVGRR